MSSPLADVRSDAVDAARRSCAWFRREGVAWVELRGADSVDLLNRLSTNDLTTLVAPGGCHTVLLTDKARIIDVLAVLAQGDRTMLLGSVGTGSTVVQWLRKYTIADDVRATDRSATVAMIDVVGPRAGDLLREATGSAVQDLGMTQWLGTSVAGVAATIVRIPSTTELTYRVVVAIDDLPVVETFLRTDVASVPELTAAEEHYLRVVGGGGAIGSEWSDAYNPLEAGLLHMTSFRKGCYIGQEVISRLDSYNKVKQRLMGFRSADPIAAGASISVDGTVVGKVTSVTVGLTGEVWYALGYIRNEHAHPEALVTIGDGEAARPATIQALPMQDSAWLS